MNAVVLCSRAPQNVMLNQALQRRSRAVMAKKCTKKREARAELSFCQSKAFAFAVLVDVAVVVAQAPY